MISVWIHWVSFSVREYICNKEFAGSTNRCLGRLHIIHQSSADAAQTFHRQSKDVLRTQHRRSMNRAWTFRRQGVGDPQLATWQFMGICNGILWNSSDLRM